MLFRSRAAAREKTPTPEDAWNEIMKDAEKARATRTTTPEMDEWADSMILEMHELRRKKEKELAELTKRGKAAEPSKKKEKKKKKKRDRSSSSSGEEAAPAEPKQRQRRLSDSSTCSSSGGRSAASSVSKKKKHE